MADTAVMVGSAAPFNPPRGRQTDAVRQNGITGAVLRRVLWQVLWQVPGQVRVRVPKAIASDRAHAYFAPPVFAGQSLRQVRRSEWRAM